MKINAQDLRDNEHWDVLLPVVVGACVFQPSGAVSVLEISLPEGN